MRTAGGGRLGGLISCSSRRRSSFTSPRNERPRFCHGSLSELPRFQCFRVSSQWFTECTGWMSSILSCESSHAFTDVAPRSCPADPYSPPPSGIGARRGRAGAFPLPSKYIPFLGARRDKPCGQESGGFEIPEPMNQHLF